VFDEIDRVGTISSVYFEGGEPFLFYPLLLEGVRLSKARGLTVGIVTNAYWATSVTDAEVWLKPLCEIGIDDLSVSDDEYHRYGSEENFARNAAEAARNLGMPAGSICIEAPVVQKGDETLEDGSIVGGDVRFRGRAADNLTEGLPRTPCNTMTVCDREVLDNPGRVHVDSFGHVQVCQGVSMGNMWATPLSELIAQYDPQNHPVVGPLLKGGPLGLVEAYDIAHEPDYVDECHFCYDVRKKLLDRFPDHLAPRQVYGIKD
jgi:hypothetical protein